MGQFIGGRWVDEPLVKTAKSGEFQRKKVTFRKWIGEDPKYPAEFNRYHLYVSHACPWAHRTIIFRKLKCLENGIGLSVVNPIMGSKGWDFRTAYPGTTGDRCHQAENLGLLYLMADSNYTGRVTVPVLWDTKTNSIVNNESSDIIRMFNSSFNHFTNNTDDYYPAAFRSEIDAINELVYHTVNNGVYKAGFASTQSAYEAAVNALFATLDQLDHRLQDSRYLIGDSITEADWRLFPTLVRFDAVYVNHFKCNLKRISDFIGLSRYLHELYWQPGIKETVHLNHIKDHYFKSHPSLNPKGIVPSGPNLKFMLAK